MINKFWIEETEQHITLYINNGISKRIDKLKCPVENRLPIVLDWLNEMNVHSTFMYGRYARKVKPDIEDLEERL